MASLAALALAVPACDGTVGVRSDSCGGGGSEIDGACPCPPGEIRGAGGCAPFGGSGGLGTDWHPDADGDGVSRPVDVCPHLYDPGQVDSDGDGTGDPCDPDSAAYVPGGPVLDLLAEHVTPYGAWLSFTSPETTDYGWEGVLAWSRDRSDLQTAGGVAALASAGQGFEIDVDAGAGSRIARPYVIRGMEPDTTYYVTVRRYADYQNLSTTPGNIVELTTHPAPQVSPGPEHPRVLADRAILEALRARHQSGDAAWSAARAAVGPEAIEAAAESGDDVEDLKYCAAAALLWQVTGEPAYQQAAHELLDGLVDYWEGQTLTGNQYRWADAALGGCADLLWNELDLTARERIVRALLEEDEQNADPRLEDTDETAATARTRLIDGLLACGADGISAALADRACAVLQDGLRLFYGVQLVKARRDRGVWAQSGGHLPDGMEYAQGSASYWMESLWALQNAGAPVSEYAAYVLHNLAALSLHPLTPRRRGLAAFGDLDNPENPQEPGGLSLTHTSGSLLGLQAALLERFGHSHAAGWARHQRRELYGEDGGARAFFVLLSAQDEGAKDYREELETAYLDSGLGRFYDRSSWSQDASLFVFRAGWAGVDHSHEDAGSFQLYRGGRWITHEVLGYDGAAARAAGKNVPQLEVPSDEGARIGQFALSPAAPARILRVASTERYAFAAADLLGAYTSHESQSHAYDAIERHLLWLKTDERDRADRLFIYDRISGGAGGARGAMIQLDAAPEIDGRHAAFSSAGEPVAIDVVFPSTAALRVRQPEGSPGQYPAALYTYGLAINANSTDSELHMLTVLRAGGPETETVASVESAGFLGALTKDALVLFPRQFLPGGAEAQIQLPSPEARLRVYWTGLSPDQPYDVRADRSGGTLSLTATPGKDLTADQAGLLTFTVTQTSILP